MQETGAAAVKQTWERSRIGSAGSKGAERREGGGGCTKWATGVSPDLTLGGKARASTEGQAGGGLVLGRWAAGHRWQQVTTVGDRWNNVGGQLAQVPAVGTATTEPDGLWHCLETGARSTFAACGGAEEGWGLYVPRSPPRVRGIALYLPMHWNALGIALEASTDQSWIMIHDNHRALR